MKFATISNLNVVHKSKGELS